MKEGAPRGGVGTMTRSVGSQRSSMGRESIRMTIAGPKRSSARVGLTELPSFSLPKAAPVNEGPVKGFLSNPDRFKPFPRVELTPRQPVSLVKKELPRSRPFYVESPKRLMPTPEKPFLKNNERKTERPKIIKEIFVARNQEKVLPSPRVSLEKRTNIENKIVAKRLTADTQQADRVLIAWQKLLGEKSWDQQKSILTTRVMDIVQEKNKLNMKPQPHAVEKTSRLLAQSQLKRAALSAPQPQMYPVVERMPMHQPPLKTKNVEMKSRNIPDTVTIKENEEKKDKRRPFLDFRAKLARQATLSFALMSLSLTKRLNTSGAKEHNKVIVSGSEIAPIIANPSGAVLSQLAVERKISDGSYSELVQKVGKIPATDSPNFMRKSERAMKSTPPVELKKSGSDVSKKDVARVIYGPFTDDLDLAA